MLQRLWNVLCSLKLTIILASAATVLTIGGSVVMIRYPKTFGMIDEMTLGAWFSRYGHNNYALTGWFWIVCLLLILLGINTLCCFFDWLPRIRYRWRKSGEYLLHLSFILILVAFIWGSYSGDRSEGHRLAIGETIDLAISPGYQLKLTAFDPTFSPEGRPNDLPSTLTLFKDGASVKEGTIRLNHPLTYGDLVILPGSLDQQTDGFRFSSANGKEEVELRPGSILRRPDGTALRVISFLPDVIVNNGRLSPGGEDLNNPAFELELIAPGREPWRGWYLLRQPLPAPLAAVGFTLQPLEPVGSWISILTINRDPGADLALLGAWCMGIGALVALISFYDKRQRGDVPDII